MGTHRALSLAWLSLLIGFVALAVSSGSAAQGRDRHCVPAFEEGKGQVWLYRTAPKSIGVPPSMEVDGQIYEGVYPGTAYHLSIAPGTHVVGLAYIKRKVTVTVEAQQRVFVRFDVDNRLFGGGFYPVIVDEQTAVAELLQHTGTDFTRPCD